MRHFYVLGIVLFSLIGCMEQPKPSIDVCCEHDDVGNYTLKWETLPPIPGRVKIYVSTNPDTFDLSNKPLAECDIEDGYTTVISHKDQQRPYFKLVFDDTYSIVTSNRKVDTKKILNMRDIGGYATQTGEHIRWGMLYRSGCLDNATSLDYKELQRLGIKTVIDLREKNRYVKPSDEFNFVRMYNFPLNVSSLDVLIDKLKKNEVKDNDINVLMQDFYIDMVSGAILPMQQIADILANEDNYPIVINCFYGKDYTGYITALILAILGTDDEVIYDDYLLSNDYLNINNVSDFYDLSIKEYDKMTNHNVVKGDINYLRSCNKEIKRNYGGVDNYLTEYLHVNNKKRRKIQQILLQHQ